MLGPNGAGKTTLVKILLGIVRISSGQAFVLGQPAGSRSARRRIGYLPENMAFPAHQTAMGAMQLAGRLHSLPEDTIRDNSVQLLESVGLADRAQDPVRQYSKGMRQRLALAQALLHDPQLLIMDEPTDGLDPIGRAEMRNLILKLKQQGKTIFLNSHLLQEVEMVCDRVAILAGGFIRGLGTPAELISQAMSSSRVSVQLELLATSEQVPILLCSCNKQETNASVQEISPGHWQIEIELSCQSDLDDWVDRIRKMQISIVRLERNQPTLEEVFLSVVDSKELPAARSF